MEELNYPFDGEIVDLRGRHLTVEQKVWIGTECNKENINIKSLCEKFNLSEDLIYSYARFVKGGIQMYFQYGRPSCIDATAFLEVQNLIDLNNTLLNDKNIEFIEILQQKTIETYNRRHNENIDGVVPPKMSDRSIKRYLLKFREAL